MSAHYFTSTYPKTNPYGKEVVKKSKGLRTVGIIFGIISAILLIVSLASLFVMKATFGDTSAGVMDYVLKYALGDIATVPAEVGEASVLQLIHSALIAVIAVFAIVYLIVSIIGMFKKKVKKSANLNLAAGIVFAVLWLVAVKELVNVGMVCYEVPAVTLADVLPFAICGYSAALAFVLCSVYGVIKTFANNGKYKEDLRTNRPGARVVFLKLFAIISTAVLLVGIVMFSRLMGATKYEAKDYVDYIQNAPLYAIATAIFGFTSEAVEAGAAMELLATSFYAFAVTLAIVYLAANLIMSILRLFVSNDYMRASDYFNKYSVGNAVLRTAFIVLIADIMMLVAKFMSMTSFDDITALLTLDNMWDIILFAVAVVLAIIYTVVRCKDVHSYYENIVFAHFFETDGVIVKARNVTAAKPEQVETVKTKKAEKGKKGTTPPLTTTYDNGSVIANSGSPFASL